MSYKRFLAMIATSTVAMFILMYTTVYSMDHVFWSSTKTYMALYMGATMAVIMLAFMLKMYDNKKANIAIFVGSTLLFGTVFWVFRSQANVGDVTYMRQMIPHHSLAILTSERANVSDPRVRRLADEIILAQKAEIAEMKALIADLTDANYEYQEPIEPSVPPIEERSEDVKPYLELAAKPLWGDVVMIEKVAVPSDAWVVAHPASPNGGADASQIIGRSFLLHGETERVPVDLDARVAIGDTIFLMLHNDTGEVGRFEFGGASTPDQPLMEGGDPVVQSFVFE